MSFKKITRERVVNDVPNVFAKDRDMHLRVNIKSYILYFWHMYKPYQTKSEMKTNKKKHFYYSYSYTNVMFIQMVELDHQKSEAKTLVNNIGLN